MTIVSSSKEISALFADAHNEFPTITGKPSEDNVQSLSQRNFQALQNIYLGDGTDTMSLILSEVDHKATNTNQVFDRSNGALEAYDPSILIKGLCCAPVWRSACHASAQRKCQPPLRVLVIIFITRCNARNSTLF